MVVTFLCRRMLPVVMLMSRIGVVLLKMVSVQLGAWISSVIMRWETRIIVTEKLFTKEGIYGSVKPLYDVYGRIVARGIL